MFVARAKGFGGVEDRILELRVDAIQVDQGERLVGRAGIEEVFTGEAELVRQGLAEAPIALRTSEGLAKVRKCLTLGQNDTAACVSFGLVRVAHTLCMRTSGSDAFGDEEDVKARGARLQVEVNTTISRTEWEG